MNWCLKKKKILLTTYWNRMESVVRRSNWHNWLKFRLRLKRYTFCIDAITSEIISFIFFVQLEIRCAQFSDTKCQEEKIFAVLISLLKTHGFVVYSGPTETTCYFTRGKNVYWHPRLPYRQQIIFASE